MRRTRREPNVPNESSTAVHDNQLLADKNHQDILSHQLIGLTPKLRSQPMLRSGMTSAHSQTMMSMKTSPNPVWYQVKGSLDVQDESNWLVVYTDGACKGNGQKTPVAGVGVWWGRNDPRNIAERCPGIQTNNRAELIVITFVNCDLQKNKFIPRAS